MFFEAVVVPFDEALIAVGIFFTTPNKQARQGILNKGKYHCTIDLLFDWLGLVCFANKNKNCQLSYS
jgi:hypothetical protein